MWLHVCTVDVRIYSLVDKKKSICLGEHQNTTQMCSCTHGKHTKSPPGVQDVMPPAETVVDH